MINPLGYALAFIIYHTKHEGVYVSYHIPTSIAIYSMIKNQMILKDNNSIENIVILIVEDRRSLTVAIRMRIIAVLREQSR